MTASTSQPEPCPMAPYAPQETVAAERVLRVTEDGARLARIFDAIRSTPPADAPEQQDDEDAQVVLDALDELRHLTTCRCDEAWTDRGLHDTHCASEYREDVNTVSEALASRRA